MTEEMIVKAALDEGFKAAAFMNVSDLVIKPEYRKYCEMNLCHCYDLVPACPPKSGTVEEMTERVMKHERLLVLQTEYDTDFTDDPEGAKAAKKSHNEMTERLIEKTLKNQADSLLIMSAGPYKKHSCMSAYCVDVQLMADVVGMTCWADDKKCRLFSQVLI